MALSLSLLLLKLTEVLLVVAIILPRRLDTQGSQVRKGSNVETRGEPATDARSKIAR